MVDVDFIVEYANMKALRADLDAYHEANRKKRLQENDGRYGPRVLDLTYAEIAKKLNVSEEAVKGWMKRKKVPADRVLLWCQVTGQKPEDVRPDIYPPTACHPLLGDVLLDYAERLHKSTQSEDASAIVKYKNNKGTK